MTAPLSPAHARQHRPARHETYDLVVIGGGPAGLAAARMAAHARQTVALVERDRLGGNSFNQGSIPSKALLRTARWFGDLHDGVKLGAERLEPTPDFAQAMRRMRTLRAHLNTQNSPERLEEAGVHLFHGHARFTGSDTLRVDDEPLRFRFCLVATGATLRAPAIPGLSPHVTLTDETAWELEEAPRRLLVVGGGPWGCEAAQAFAQLGSRVTIAQKEAKFLPFTERDAAQTLARALARYGVDTRLDTEVVAVRTQGASHTATLKGRERTQDVEVDAILAATGRQPCTDGLDLEVAGVALDPERGVVVDDHLCTANPRVYAAGDVCAGHRFTNAARATGQLAVQNMLAVSEGRPLERRAALVVPRCTHTDPEVAHVGLLIQDAREAGIKVNTTTIMLHQVDRAVCDGEEDGFLKVHVRDGTDEIVGAVAVGRHTGEMLAAITGAMTFGIGFSRLAQVIQPYPTVAEIARMAAEAFSRANTQAPHHAETFDAT